MERRRPILYKCQREMRRLLSHIRCTHRQTTFAFFFQRKWNNLSHMKCVRVVRRVLDVMNLFKPSVCYRIGIILSLPSWKYTTFFFLTHTRSHFYFISLAFFFFFQNLLINVFFPQSFVQIHPNTNNLQFMYSTITDLSDENTEKNNTHSSELK